MPNHTFHKGGPVPWEQQKAMEILDWHSTHYRSRVLLSLVPMANGPRHMIPNAKPLSTHCVS